MCWRHCMRRSENPNSFSLGQIPVINHETSLNFTHVYNEYIVCFTL